MASMEGELNAVEMLLQFHAAVDPLDNDQNTPLHLAVIKGHLKVVEILLLHKANHGKYIESGETAPHMAAHRGRAVIASLLLDHQAPINSRNIYGKTPLHAACVSGHADVVRVLLQRGADRTAWTFDFKSPRDLAGKYNQQDVIQVLDQFEESLQKKVGKPAQPISTKKTCDQNDMPELMHKNVGIPPQPIVKNDHHDDITELMETTFLSIRVPLPRVWLWESQQQTGKLYIPLMIGRKISLYRVPLMISASARWISSPARSGSCWLATASAILSAASMAKEDEPTSLDVHQIWSTPGTTEVSQKISFQVPIGSQYVSDGCDGVWGLCAPAALRRRNLILANHYGRQALSSDDVDDSWGPLCLVYASVSYAGDCDIVAKKIPLNVKLFVSQRGGVWLFAASTDRVAEASRLLSPGLWYFDLFQDPIQVWSDPEAGETFEMASDASRNGVFIWMPSLQEKDVSSRNRWTLMYFDPTKEGTPQINNKIYLETGVFEVQSISDDGTDHGVYVHYKDRTQRWKLGYASLTGSRLICVLDLAKTSKFVVDRDGGRWTARKTTRSQWERALFYRPHPGKTTNYAVG